LSSWKRNSRRELKDSIGLSIRIGTIPGLCEREALRLFGYRRTERGITGEFPRDAPLFFFKLAISKMVVLDASAPRLDVYSNVQLFPHQQALVHKMIELESSPRKEVLVSTLMDAPGTGKSFPLLAMILHEKRQFGSTQNLLVIPHNIHEQWLEYISRFSSELTARSLMYYGDINALFYDARALFNYDILITTSTFYTMVTDTVQQIGGWFHRVILDEIDSIAFFTKSAIPTQAVWLVSASADLTNQGAYAEVAKKNSIQCDPLFIKRSINLPPPIVEHHYCYNEYVPILQRGNLVQEMKAVYANDFTVFKFDYLRNESIDDARSLLSATFRNFSLAYQSTLDSIDTLQKGAQVQVYLQESLSNQIAKRDQLNIDLGNIMTLLSKRKCPICCDNLVEKSRVSTRCCSSIFCSDCMDAWIGKSQSPRCPRCCTKMTRADAVPDNSPVAPPPPVSGKKDKIPEFEEVIKKEKERENFRILVFSDYTGTFLKIYPILKKYNLAYAEIEGNQLTMSRAIEDYKSGAKPVLLVDSQAYGAGMNMELTTAVVIVHKTDREAQIIGRAQRLGRTDRLHVHHLVYDNENGGISP
jgi:SNF2 family DNA or RNA helicase